MTDYIKREDAIKGICCCECLDCEAIAAIPAADVRPNVRGEWTYKFKTDMFQCSRCKGIAVRNIYPFCPWCGADMRGE